MTFMAQSEVGDHGAAEDCGKEVAFLQKSTDTHSMHRADESQKKKGRCDSHLEERRKEVEDERAG